MAYRACKICDDPHRQDVELAYLTGERVQLPYSRASIERHMAHVTEPEALKLALGMSAATALASRLHHLETQATLILDAAMAVEQTEDGKSKLSNPLLALKAMREVRATIELMGRVAGTLVDRVQVDQARPDLDAAIADALASRGHDVGPMPQAEPQAEPEPAWARQPLELGPGMEEPRP